ncbi:hypothetical protein L6164_004713 [Bauhinia variegata]|uniref:Uncharacterized protein n=1 Tax=Bauhinia variegata TaxID=167791 RepID=A0ACB9PUI6_BAUVA|nr:hypothetical protein L6164_004713 [Bauhinia variegata]
MADWSQLPKELVQVIAERLEKESEFYVLRFRSVCSSWRSSVPIKHHPLPARFPILTNDSKSDACGSFYLSKRTIFLVAAPRNLSRLNPDPWLVKIGEDDHGRKQHFDLLSRFRIKPPHMDFPKVLDINELPVLELAQEYVLNPNGFRNSIEDAAASLYREKVVFMWLNSGKEQFVLLTIHVSGKLALFKSDDKEWTIIPYMFTPYDDVIAFKRKLYAVDSIGRTVVVGLDSNLSLVAEPVFGGDKKFLVESNDDLLLVDKYLSPASDQDSIISDEFDEEIEGSTCERAARFSVFKLEEETNKWLALKSLGNRILFLGDDCTFSASVADLSISKGNCIIFLDDFLYLYGEQSGIGFFNLDDGKIFPLSDYPGYFKLFCPPPDWVRLPRQTEQLEELTL